MNYFAFAALTLIFVGFFVGLSAYAITGIRRKGELQGGMPWYERFPLEVGEVERGWADVWLILNKVGAQRGCLHFTDRRVVYTPIRGRMSYPIGVLSAPFGLTYDELTSSETRVIHPLVPMALPTGTRALVLHTEKGVEHVFLPNGMGLHEVAARLLPKCLQTGKGA